MGPRQKPLLGYSPSIFRESPTGRGKYRGWASNFFKIPVHANDLIRHVLPFASLIARANIALKTFTRNWNLTVDVFLRLLPQAPENFGTVQVVSFERHLSAENYSKWICPQETIHHLATRNVSCSSWTTKWKCLVIHGQSSRPPGALEPSAISPPTTFF